MKFIALGMRNGSVFIFDHFEKLCMELAPTDPISQKGITALDFSHNGQNLVVAHDNGWIVLWDVIAKKELKKVKEGHTHPITFLKFFKKGQLKIVSMDCTGIITFIFKQYINLQTKANLIFLKMCV